MKHLIGSKSTMGPAIATLIVSAWLSSMAYALFCMSPEIWPLSARQIVLFFWLQYLYVGLFITAHDACHGSLAPGKPRVNLIFGYVCAALYAGFNFKRLATKHILHHKHVGTKTDPDFHVTSADSQNFGLWVFHFFSNYLTWGQFAIMTAVSQILLTGLQIPPSLVYFYWVGPSVCSALQLFYFGTFLPHRLDCNRPFVDHHRARNSSFGFIFSLLSCYHFGYHHVHHVNPHLPWYRLPQGRP